MRSLFRPPTPRSRLAGLWILIALACSACGSSSSGSQAPGGQSATTSAPSSTVTSTSTTSTTTSTTTSSLPGAGKPQVTIGDKNYTEQFVLGELYRQALLAQGFSVQLNQNIGPTEVTLQALKSDSLAMYPEYLNVFNSAVAAYSRSFATQPEAYQAAQVYAEAHGLKLLAATPFSDTDAIGVTVGYAQVNHLRSLNDLTKVATSLTIGGPPQFAQSSPGLPDVERAYGFTPAAFKPLAVGQQYDALDADSVQAAQVYTTDGQLASGNYRLLSDPGNVFGWGNVVPVVTAYALSREGPAFAATIDRVSQVLTTSVMRQLNQAVDVAGEDPAAVAKEFLETHGLIPPSPS